MNSIRNNNNKNNSFSKTKLYRKIDENINQKCLTTSKYKLKTIKNPDNNVSIWFPTVKEQSIIVDPSYNKALFNNTSEKLSQFISTLYVDSSRQLSRFSFDVLLNHVFKFKK